MKQQWITSNQAQSTEGVIMHTAAASLSLCKPSLSPSSLSCSLSLSLKALWAEWLICDYWFLENVGGIERERGRGRGGGRGRGRGGGRGRGRGGGSIQYSEERLAAALASGSLRFRKKKKKRRSQWVQSLESARSPPSIPPFFSFSHLLCSSRPFIFPLPFSSSFSSSFPSCLRLPPRVLCRLNYLWIFNKKCPSVSATSRKELRAERKKSGRVKCLGKKNKNICPS